MRVFQPVPFGGWEPEDGSGGRYGWYRLLRPHLVRSFVIITVCGLVLAVSGVASLIHFIDALFGSASVPPPAPPQ
jgi:hypothetical protein